jgi:signal transduction histidine kinase/CheY-like chemotaxis protein
MDKIMWNNISIKNKLMLIVFLPLVALCFLAFQELEHLEAEVSSTEKAKNVILFFEEIADYQVPSIEKAKKIHNLVLDIFPNNEKIVDILSKYKENVIAAKNSPSQKQKIEIRQERLELYKKVLIMLEQIHYNHLNKNLDNYLQSLYQMEWMKVWLVEEEINISLLKYNNKSDKVEQLLKNINKISYRSELFYNRFMEINKKENQVEMFKLIMDSGSFKDYLKFREELFENKYRIYHQADLKNGIELIQKKRSAITKIETNVYTKAKSEAFIIHSGISNKKQTFLLSSIIFAIILFFIAFSVSKKITLNLKGILKFLENGDHKEIENIKGNDEISTFSNKVEKLTTEIIEAKNSAIKANEAKSVFLANMSHEIRTPLNGIIGMIEVMNDTELNTVQKEYLQTVDTSSQLLLTLINDVLDFSKIESGNIEVTPTITNIRETIYDIVSVNIQKAVDKNLTINVDLEENIPSGVLVDDHKLRQVLMNLMSNSIKFTNRGVVNISANVLTVSKESKKIRFEVSDTGIGIEKSRQKNIFNSFIQEDSSTTKKYGGTGLGLAISAQLIELMGSKIELISEKNMGSRFFFDLDLKESSVPNDKDLNNISVTLISKDVQKSKTIMKEFSFYNVLNVNKKHSLEDINIEDKDNLLVIVEDKVESNDFYDKISSLIKEGYNICLIKDLNNKQKTNETVSGIVLYPVLGERMKKSLKLAFNKIKNTGKKEKLKVTDKIKVLLVEDNRVNQQIAIIHLKNAGMESTLAENGLEAVNKYKSKEKFDVILMDCMMPVKDGFEATKEIREYEDKNNMKRIPIIALTASVIDDDIQHCFNVGMNSYIPKPVKRDFLIGEIKKLHEANNKK